MNMRNRNARNASRASSDFFSYLFFKDKVIKKNGMISGIQSTGFSVLIPEFGLEGFLEFDEEDLKANAQLMETEKQLSELVVNGKRLRIFEWVGVRIEVKLKSFRKVIVLNLLNSLV